MKATVVPAQVTTVEDRIMGSLGFTQLLLLITPLFSGAGIYALLPPFMNESLYKDVVIGSVALLCCTLALRIRGNLIAHWLIVVLRFRLRPKFYLFNKNTLAYRQQYDKVAPEPDTPKANPVLSKNPHTPRLTLRETTRALAAIDNPARGVRYKTTKTGGLYVHFSSIEKECE